MLRKLFLGCIDRFVNWCRVRARFVVPLWFVIGLVGYCAALRWPETRDEILHKLHDFDDWMLVGALFVAGIICIGCKGLLSHRDSGVWTGGIADEVSDAATTFATISVVLMLWEGWDRTMPSLTSMSLTLGMFVTGIAFCEYEPPKSKTIREDLGLEFTYPDENQLVGEVTKIVVTARKQPPPETTLWLVRRWEDHEGQYYPLAEIHLNKSLDGNTWTWSKHNGYVGGEPSKRQKRRFEVWLIGPEGERLFRHYMKWDSYLGELRSRNECPRITLISRAIEDQPADGICLAERWVERL